VILSPLRPVPVRNYLHCLDELLNSSNVSSFSSGLLLAKSVCAVHRFFEDHHHQKRQWLSTFRSPENCDRDDLCLFLGGVGCAPKRARIDAVWIEFEHLFIELTRVRSCFVQAVEIAKVFRVSAMIRGSSSFSGTLCPATTAFGFRASSLSSVEIHSSRLCVSVSPR
jgi:hypothetical protein